LSNLYYKRVVDYSLFNVRGLCGAALLAGNLCLALAAGRRLLDWFFKESLEGRDRAQVVKDNIKRLGLYALIAIGGDDTLKTANYMYEFQRRLVGAAWPTGQPSFSVSDAGTGSPMLYLDRNLTNGANYEYRCRYRRGNRVSGLVPTRPAPRRRRCSAG
jgi:hypothetical protein